jgi:putative Mg2+ transporter-C (MgtC) family protein
MTPEQVEIAMRLGAAVAVGAAIGLERELRGRPAGFRTHILVCLASALLMQMSRGATDPGTASRLAQGLMTGIGFLGAGAIFKEGLTVRGLTTAASIWITAAMGVVLGMGLYYVAALWTVVTLAVLVVLNWAEAGLPSRFYADHRIRFARDAIPDEDSLRALLASHGFTVMDLSNSLIEGGRVFEYRMVIGARDRSAPDRLSHTLLGRSDVIEFDIAPKRD